MTPCPSSTPIQTRFFDQNQSRNRPTRRSPEVPGALSFVKDTRGRFISINKRNAHWLGLRSPDEIVGATDYDFFSSSMADSFLESDEEILRTGQPLKNKPERITGVHGESGWFLTTKSPVFAVDGHVIGIEGTAFPRDEIPLQALADPRLRRVVAHLRANANRNVTVSEMVRVAAMSERQLHRQFKEGLGTTPLQFAIGTRLIGATKALVETRLPIAQIAQDSGFYDQSSFCHQFRKKTGETPSAFRRRRQAARL